MSRTANTKGLKVIDKRCSLFDEALSLQVSALLIVKELAEIDVDLARSLFLFESDSDVIAIREASRSQLQRLGREKQILNASGFGVNGIKSLLDNVKDTTEAFHPSAKLKVLAMATSIHVDV